MSDDKPNPLEDVKQGLGLLFRAAKTAVERLPTEKIEEAVTTSAREVGRAVETVHHEIEKTYRKATGGPPPPEPRRPEAEAAPSPPTPPSAATDPPEARVRVDDGYAAGTGPTGGSSDPRS